MMDDREMAKKIPLYTGGAKNVIQVTHCAARLWLALGGPKEVWEAELKDLPLVKGMIESGGQFQVTLGAGIINKVYKEFTTPAGGGAGKSLEKGAGDGTGNGAQTEAKGSNGIQRILRMFGDTFLPVIPVIAANGALMGARSFLAGSGLMTMDSDWYNIMAILIDMGFSFLPALIYYSVAKKSGGLPILEFVLGLIVISSTLPVARAVGKGNAGPMLVQLLRITFRLTGFQGPVLVAIVGGWLTTEVKNMCCRFVPNVFDVIPTLILTLGISLFVILFGVGSAIHVVGAGVVSALRMLVQPPSGINGFIIGGFQQTLAILGVHRGLWIIDISFPEEVGTNTYMPIRTAVVVGQAGVVTSFFYFAKDKKLKALAGSSSIAAWFGITKPAIFGITLPYNVTFALGCIGSALDGLFSALMYLSAAGTGVSATPSYLLFLNGGAVEYILVCLISTDVSFVLTAVYIKKKGIQGNERIAYAHP